MGSLFVEFENENALRSYPFASGCTARDTAGNAIGTGVLIDAAVYPVNATGTPYLSGISASGIISISDDSGVIMTATHEPGSATLEFYDTTVLKRHAATVLASSPEALAALANVYEDRTFRKSETAFAASCVFPVANDGVTSVSVGDVGALDGSVTFANGPDDAVRVSTDGTTLRFDVVPPRQPEDFIPIRHVYCIVDGRTPFRLIKLDGTDASSGSSDTGGGNTVALYLDNIERGDVCANAHRENAYEMDDRCADCSDGSCYVPPEDPEDIPYVYQSEAVDMSHGARSAFYLTVPNFTGYDNPLSLTLSDGMTLPKTDVTVERNGDNLSKILDTVNSKGVVLQVPGLAKAT